MDIGSGGDPLTIVTNASNVRVDSRVVVATVGCELRDGTTVKKAAVGGVSSEGMLCDAPMLGWVGGGAGAAALVPETFSAGDASASAAGARLRMRPRCQARATAWPSPRRPSRPRG